MMALLMPVVRVGVAVGGGIVVVFSTGKRILYSDEYLAILERTEPPLVEPVVGVVTATFLTSDALVGVHLGVIRHVSFQPLNEMTYGSR